MMDIVNYFHARTQNTISQINIQSESCRYMRLSVFESLKSVYLYIKRDYLSKINEKSNAPWMTRKKKINFFVEEILKKSTKLANSSEYGQNNEIRNFICNCKSKIIEEFCKTKIREKKLIANVIYCQTYVWKKRLIIKAVKFGMK